MLAGWTPIVPFRPHLTLGRLCFLPRTEFPRQIIYTTDCTFTIMHFVCVRWFAKTVTFDRDTVAGEPDRGEGTEEIPRTGELINEGNKGKKFKKMAIKP